MAAEKRLIKTGEHTPAKWMTNDDINQLYMNKIRFMDITETQDLDKDVVRNVLEGESAIPTVPTQQAVVKPILALGTTDMMKSVLKTLTEFNNRYYRSSTGQQSADWLFGKVQEVIAATGTKLNVTTSQFKHSWNQSSIITRIEGKSGNQETVILGAHQDSINGRSPMSGRSQGADDDGSGTVTILEALRMILVGGYEPLRPVEFHWYSGEEAGLLGSQAIAKSYKAAGRLVAGMLQTDMSDVIICFLIVCSHVPLQDVPPRWHPHRLHGPYSDATPPWIGHRVYWFAHEGLSLRLWML
jgi:leucyl aminopeptidase